MTNTPAPKRRWLRFALLTMAGIAAIVAIRESLAVRRTVLQEKALRLMRDEGIFMDEWLLDKIGWQPDDDLPTIQRKLDQENPLVYIASTSEKQDAELIERTLRDKGMTECMCFKGVQMLPAYSDYAVMVEYKDAKLARRALKHAPLDKLPIKLLPMDLQVEEQ